MPPPIERLAAEDVLDFLAEQEFSDAIDPEVTGAIFIGPGPEGAGPRVVAAVRPGTPGSERERFAGWAAGRFRRFAEHGPEPDGWGRGAGEGEWYLWGRTVYMPDPGSTAGTPQPDG